MYWNKEFETMPWLEVHNYCLKNPLYRIYQKYSEYYKSGSPLLKLAKLKQWKI